MAKYQTWELTPDEVIDGLTVEVVAGAGNEAKVKVNPGMYRIEGKVYEVKEAVELTNVTSGTAPVEVVVYANPAKDYAGNTLTAISFTPEADSEKLHLFGGTTGRRYGRSLPIAKFMTLTTTVNVDGATLDNTVKQDFTAMNSEKGN